MPVFLILVMPLLVGAGETSPPRLLGVHYLGDLPTLVADERGYFRDAAADLGVAYTSSGRTNLRKLRAGETDFALMAFTPLVIDALNDSSPGESSDPVILANLVHSHRLNQVVTPGSSGIAEPAELEGKRVGLMKGTNAEFVWSLFARMHGLNSRAVTLVDLAVDQLPAALTGGRIDAAVLWEPWTSRTARVAQDGVRILPGSSSYTAHWVLVARRGFAREHPEMVRALLNGYVRAIDWIDHHRDESLEVYARHVELAPALLERNWTTVDYGLDLDWTVLNGLRLQLQWAREAGYGSGQTQGPGVLELVEPGPLRRLDPYRVSIPRARPEEAP